MATYTENYGFTKVSAEDHINLNDFNANLDIFDEQLATAEEKLNNVNEKIGANENGETVFSLLKNDRSIIKSAQRVMHTSTYGETTASISIETVVPEKCIILFERLKDSSNLTSVDYTLHSTSIEITHDSANGGQLVLGFWIIEFN